LRIQRQPLGSLDIVNSQPALLALLIHSHALGTEGDRHGQPGGLSIYDGKPFPPPEGHSEYEQLATSGRLYEHLMEKTGLSRADVKVGLLREVFGKHDSYPSAVESASRQSFPGVYAFVRRFNRDDHGSLLKELQRVESDLVIRQVGSRLSESGAGPCISLHDSVFCRRGELHAVDSAFRRQLTSIGFSLQLKAA
jgi:hypothetical protein